MKKLLFLISLMVSSCSQVAFAQSKDLSSLVNSTISHELPALPGYSMATTTALAAVTNMTTPDLAYVQANQTLYLYNGTSWNPVFSSGSVSIAATQVSFNNSGTPYTSSNVQNALVEAVNWI